MRNRSFCRRIFENKLHLKIRASAPCYIGYEMLCCCFVVGMYGIGIDVRQSVESTFQTDIPLLGRINVETYMNLTDAGDRVGEDLDGLLEGVHDCATGFGADVLAELK